MPSFSAFRTEIKTTLTCQSNKRMLYSEDLIKLIKFLKIQKTIRKKIISRMFAKQFYLILSLHPFIEFFSSRNSSESVLIIIFFKVKTFHLAKKLYFTIEYIALKPSLHPIFFPSS